MWSQWLYRDPKIGSGSEELIARWIVAGGSSMADAIGISLRNSADRLICLASQYRSTRRKVLIGSRIVVEIAVGSLK